MTDWPLLRSLDPDAQRRLRAAGRRRRFARREVIFHEGDPGDTLHLIERGHVAVRVTTPMGDVVTFSIIGPGATFGEMALLDDASVRAATATALERADTWALHRDQFNELRSTDRQVDRFLVELFAGHVRRLSDQLVEALHVSADKRVARRLLDLVGVYHGRGGEIPLTQEELASLAGTSRAMVNRVLGELATAGAVEVGRGRITVLDVDRLVRAGR